MKEKFEKLKVKHDEGVKLTVKKEENVQRLEVHDDKFGGKDIGGYDFEIPMDEAVIKKEERTLKITLKVGAKLPTWHRKIQFIKRLTDDNPDFTTIDLTFEDENNDPRRNEALKREHYIGTRSDVDTMWQMNKEGDMNDYEFEIN